jgi:NAD(P)-dependent dehydrogenase (short-subunit alcohol dehydrogenase family)
MTSAQFAHYPDLSGRSVFISGGATGIGASLVENFAKQGAKVAFVDIDHNAGKTLKDTLTAAGHSVIFIACDITVIEDYQQAIQQAATEHGPITVLLNNAANDQRHTIEEVDEVLFDKLIAVNLKHQLFAAQTVIPMMQQAGGGSIINFSSVSWKMAVNNLSIYMTCKAGIHGLTRGLARDFGKDNIRVNSLLPGWVMTEKQLQHRVDEAAKAEIAANQMLAGPLMPQHISDMALFLGSEASAMCTAQEFIIDGGWV